MKKVIKSIIWGMLITISLLLVPIGIVGGMIVISNLLTYFVWVLLLVFVELVTIHLLNKVW